MLLFAIGLIWYGWSAQEHAEWIVPQIGTAFFGLGQFMAFVSLQIQYTPQLLL